MSNLSRSSIFLRFLLICLLFPCVSYAEEARFMKFSASLPEGWSGDETTGFISDNSDEYMLALTRQNEARDAVAAQVTIYLLPNKPGKNARDSAISLAESQGEASTPRQEGLLWTFTGEPRTRTLKGAGQTWVNADSENLLIIIAQGPENMGASEIVRSLKAETPEAKKLLGR